MKVIISSKTNDLSAFNPGTIVINKDNDMILVVLGEGLNKHCFRGVVIYEMSTYPSVVVGHISDRWRTDVFRLFDGTIQLEIN